MGVSDTQLICVAEFSRVSLDRYLIVAELGIFGLIRVFLIKSKGGGGVLA